MLSDRLLGYLVGLLLKQLDAKIAAQAVVALLRAALDAIKSVAERTASPLDDQLVGAARKIVDELAAKLGVP